MESRLGEGGALTPSQTFGPRLHRTPKENQTVTTQNEKTPQQS